MCAHIHLYINHLRSEHTATCSVHVSGSPRNPLTNVKPIILVDAGRSVSWLAGRSVGRSVGRSLSESAEPTRERGEGGWKHDGDARVAAAGQKRPRKARDYFVPRRRPARASRRRGGRRKRRKRRRRDRASEDGGSGERGKGVPKLFACASRRAASSSRRATPSRATPRLDRPRWLGRDAPRRNCQGRVSRRVRVACACWCTAQRNAPRQHAPGRVVDGGGARPAR